MAQLTVNGAEIAVFDAGSGDPPFVFVHGLANDHTVWQPQFDDLSRDYRCVAVDLRGCGASAAVPPFDTTQAAEDIAEVVRTLGLGPAIVAGHGSGGLVALLLNDRHPELVRGIVLGDATLSSASGGGWPELERHIRDDGTLVALGPLIDGFFGEGTSPELRERIRAMVLATPTDVAAGMVSNSDDLRQRMGELLRAADQKPLMAIWSQVPRGNPERLRETLFFIRQEPIAGAGHFFQLEQPAVTNALLRAFVDDVLRDPRVSHG